MITPLALMVRNTQLLYQAGNQRLRSLSTSLISAQEDERRRISLTTTKRAILDRVKLARYGKRRSANYPLRCKAKSRCG
jgi:hypothetical protein